MSKISGQQLYDYAKSHGLCSEVSKNWTIKHFHLIAEALGVDEQVLTAFSGFHNYKKMSEHDGIFAYAITNKRFIIAQKKMIGSVSQTISLNNVNDITMKKGMLNHVITVDTIKETFNVSTSDAKTAQNIYAEIHAALETAKRGSASSNAGSQTISTQLIELKKLLDTGIITQRDFDLKKQKILGI